MGKVPLRRRFIDALSFTIQTWRYGIVIIQQLPGHSGHQFALSDRHERRLPGRPLQQQQLRGCRWFYCLTCPARWCNLYLWDLCRVNRSAGRSMALIGGNDTKEVRRALADPWLAHRHEDLTDVELATRTFSLQLTLGNEKRRERQDFQTQHHLA